MNTLAKLTLFGALLGVLLAGGIAAGAIVDPAPPNAKKAEVAMAAMGDASEATTMGVRGLAVAENGLRLVIDTSSFARGRTDELRFRIVGGEGRTVRDFDVEHTKRMHLIVVRRDLTGFQHLHPTESADGEWRVPLRLGAAGSYRVFADFSHGGQQVTLASDLDVDGAYDHQPLPAATTSAFAGGGYTVRLDPPRAVAGHEASLRFTVVRDGRPVKVEQYLGADGHLVALRQGDLAFLHVHPVERGNAAERTISFNADLPTAGRYRLFLQFKVDGRVHTAAYTLGVS